MADSGSRVARIGRLAKKVQDVVKMSGTSRPIL